MILIDPNFDGKHQSLEIIPISSNTGNVSLIPPEKQYSVSEVGQSNNVERSSMTQGSFSAGGHWQEWDTTRIIAQIYLRSALRMIGRNSD